MSVAKFVNEENKISYDTETDIYGLIEYMFTGHKTMYDEIRPGHILKEMVGCSYFFGDESQEKQSEQVAMQMTINNRAYGKWRDNLMKHRIISFDKLDYVLPNEAYLFAKYVADAYGENYITAYAVHMDTNNIHIHLAIDTISWRDGKRFSVSYEKRWLYSLLGSWMTAHGEIMHRTSSQEVYEKYMGWN